MLRFILPPHHITKLFEQKLTHIELFCICFKLSFIRIENNFPPVVFFYVGNYLYSICILYSYKPYITHHGVPKNKNPTTIKTTDKSRATACITYDNMCTFYVCVPYVWVVGQDCGVDAVYIHTLFGLFLFIFILLLHNVCIFYIRKMAYDETKHFIFVFQF